MDSNQPEAGNNSVAPERLRSVVERYERLDQEIRELRDDQKDIMAEAKSAGFDVKVLRQLIHERREEPDAIEERESLLELYRNALGQLVGTPLANAVMERA
jgi:uncharacterized protein (UPF0335 family)